MDEVITTLRTNGEVFLLTERHEYRLFLHEFGYFSCHYRQLGLPGWSFREWSTVWGGSERHKDPASLVAAVLSEGTGPTGTVGGVRRKNVLANMSCGTCMFSVSPRKML